MTQNTLRTARYRIIIDDTHLGWRHAQAEKKRKAQWSRFTDTCRALAKDGFDYAVAIERTTDRITGDRITLKITGTAGKAEVTRKPMRRAFSLPAKVSPDRCGKMAAEARVLALRGGMVPSRRRMAAWEYDAGKRAEDQRVGHLIARAKARGESVVHDGPFSWSVGATITERKRRQYAYAHLAHVETDTRAERLSALADYKYWRELEALSGQRQQFKPGLTDENFYADDEIAA